MSYDSVSHEHRRLLPESLEDQLFGLARKLIGFALIAAVATAWASLLTWSANDPSLTQATAGATRNILGQPGAVLSDLLLQLLGFTAALMLLSPMFWGIELLRNERIDRLRIRVLLYPVSVLLIAGGLSALPTHARWSLHHGYGGMVGDAIYSLTTALLAVVSAEKAAAIAGLVFFGAGFAALSRSIGYDLEELLIVLGGKRKRSMADRLVNVQGQDWPHMDAPPMTSGVGKAGMHHAGSPRSIEPDWQREPHFTAAPRRSEPAGDSRPPVHENRSQPHQSYSAAPPTADDFGGVDTDGSIDDDEPGTRGHPFENSTNADSRAIAERFAPGARRPETIGEQAQDAAARFAKTIARRASNTFRKPSLNILKRPAASKAGSELTQTVLRGNARLLEDVLADFGVKGTIKDIRPGPVVTLFELEPARGTKSSRVIGLAEDIARSMSASSARVAIVPGRNVIGIELPNTRRETVVLREILDSDQYKSNALLPICLGKGIGGEPVVADLARMPHLLVAGTTGSGKSVGINAFVLSLLYKMSPDECRLLMIDPKMLELSIYNGISHLLCPVITDPSKAVSALNWAVTEMEERYKRMAQHGVRSVDLYNTRVRNAQKLGAAQSRMVHTGFDHASGRAIYEKETISLEPMPYIVIVIDELADLMLAAGKEIEAALQRLAQMARAAGIHLIMATQRPSVDVITGTIKANFPTRISFKVASRIDSRTILNEQGAEQLLGQGDMLYSAGGGQISRVHGAFVTDEEVEEVARFLREQGEPRYVDGITEEKTAPGFDREGKEPGSDILFDKAVAIVMRDRKASISYLQRRLGIGYNRAADLMERMEQEGVVGPVAGSGKRDILLPGEPADYHPD